VTLGIPWPERSPTLMSPLCSTPWVSSNQRWSGAEHSARLRSTSQSPVPSGSAPLVLFNTCAHFVQEDDYPWGIPPQDLDALVAAIKETWGTRPRILELIAPSRVADERFRAWLARSARFGAGPDQVAKLVRASYEADVRGLLPSLSVPTLLLHREGNRYIHLGRAGTRMSTSPMPSSSSSPAKTTCSSWAIPTL
jgi:hypothetical protein